MADINPKDVMRLRNDSGLPMMDCKAALAEANGDYEKAKDILRKKMKGKIRSMSQEAKSSAAIIGVLPFLIIGGLLYTSPDYLDPLLHTDTGRIILMIAGGWMLLGVIIMRSMINFDI